VTGFSTDTGDLDRFAGDVDQAGGRLEDLAAVNQRQGTETLQRSPIPVDTGRLKESAYVTADRTGFALSATAPYAAIVHARNPFFTRAIDPDAYLDDLETHTAEILGTITGS
jgi:hypothetical protein